MRANAADRLVQHYVDNFRRLPWRSPPGEMPPDPYRVWLSEIMLQQTTVAAVTPRFERFVARWPTVEALADAADEEILSEWAGLGYYARARNLAACAREVVRRGGFPDTEEGLRALPGIGDYTAAAIAAIAFGRQTIGVDANVGRVAARLFGLERASKAEVQSLLKPLLPERRSGDFQQALMDLGATICRPRSPICGECPLQDHCVAAKGGAPEEFPKPKPRRAKPVRYGLAYWIERDHCVWLVRRPPRGLLGGMAALPGTDWAQEAPSATAAPLATVHHVFTHFELRLTVVAHAGRSGDGWWHPIVKLDEAGLPTLYRRAVDAVISARSKIAA